MICELRIYYIHKGKMPDIHKRFKDVTIDLFKKHDMEIIDFFEDIKDNKIYYIVEHADMRSRDQNLDEFKNDPEWIKAKEYSELDGPIVEKVESFFMERTPYSPIHSGA